MNTETRIPLAHAERLAECFGTSAQFWLNLQAAYDSWVAERPERAP